MVSHRLVMAAALFCGAIVLGLFGLDRVPGHDELYHLLAARGLLATGEPRIEDGLYTRGELYTWLVALSLRLLGDSPGAARVPALLVGALIPPLLFLWLDRSGQRRAALGAALLLLFSPFFVTMLVFARFYTLQMAAFLLGVVLLHAWWERPRPWRRRLAALLGAASIALAVWLQPVTLFGVAGLVPVLAAPWWFRFVRGHPRRWLLLALALAVGVAVLVGSEAWQPLWERYRRAEVFAQRFAEAPWFYHLWYQLYYPVFWGLTPLLALLALLVAPMVASLSLGIFATTFLLASFAAAKGLRYLAFAQPFLFALWGLGLARLAQLAAPLGARLPPRLAVAGLELPTRPLLALALAAVVLVQPFWVRTVAFLADQRLPFEAPDPDWSRALPQLRPWAERVAVVVTTVDVYALYFLGRHDIGFGASKYEELRDQPATPFRRDPRTGRPLTADLAALEAVLRCYRSGLFLAHRTDRGNPALLPEAAERLIRRYARPLELPPESGILAYVWERTGAAGDAAETCRRLPPIRPVPPAEER